MQIIVGAIMMSMAVYVGMAFMLIRQQAIEPMPVPPLLPPILAAVAVSTLAGAGFIVKGMTQKAGTMATPAERIQRYQGAMIVGAALRESVGVIGLVLSLLTGSLIWVGLLSGLAVFAILTNFPSRSALEKLVLDAPPIV
jgi:F0F1-type ATP synthase membrane subunit c/vacuolar-type H+-ATPase subunit K